MKPSDKIKTSLYSHVKKLNGMRQFLPHQITQLLGYGKNKALFTRLTKISLHVILLEDLTLNWRHLCIKWTTYY